MPTLPLVTRMPVVLQITLLALAALLLMSVRFWSTGVGVLIMLGALITPVLGTALRSLLFEGATMLLKGASHMLGPRQQTPPPPPRTSSPSPPLTSWRSMLPQQSATTG